jgi:hypothetical protein
MPRETRNETKLTGRYGFWPCVQRVSSTLVRRQNHNTRDILDGTRSILLPFSISSDKHVCREYGLRCRYLRRTLFVFWSSTWTVQKKVVPEAYSTVKQLWERYLIGLAGVIYITDIWYIFTGRDRRSLTWTWYTTTDLHSPRQLRVYTTRFNTPQS